MISGRPACWGFISLLGRVNIILKLSFEKNVLKLTLL